MPRRALPVALLSSSPCHLRCLAVVTAAWGANSLRPTAVFPHRHLIGTGTASTGRRAPVFCGAFSLNRRAAHQVADFSTGRRSLGGGSEIACSVGTDAPAGDPGEGAASSTAVVAEPGNAAIEVEERPWLGNGPDPMAKTGRVRPGTAASLAVGEHASAGEGTTGRVWLGNGLDPLAALGEAAVVNGSEKGKGVPFEEMWLNGPFKAPLPAEPLDIIYVDDDIVVANKPSNLLCVPGRVEKDSLATRAALELGHYRVDRMIVHRLDMATSGCVIMARTDAALKDLNRQFREREVRKRYVAMVHGVLSADEGEIDLPLCRNRGCPPLHMVNFEHGKPSLTLWRVLERAADRTRVELIPVSGRSHQLRLHCDAIGHPILGDHFYGTKESLALADRCLLHAHTLCVRHPITGKRTMFTAPCDF